MEHRRSLFTQENIYMKRKLEQPLIEPTTKRPKITNAPCGNFLYEVTDEHLTNGHFDCPVEVTHIASCAFTKCRSTVTHIIFPKGVTKIESSACSNLTNLSYIALPEGITSIGQMAFDGCTNLTHITLPKGITHLLGYTFSGCTNLTFIILPETITFIAKNVFSKCPNLQFIIISGSDENKLKQIRDLLPEELKNKVVSKCQGSIIQWQCDTKKALAKVLVGDAAGIVYQKALSFFNPKIEQELKIANEVGLSNPHAP